MTHKVFKNGSDKEQVYRNAVLSCGDDRVFAFEVSEKLTEWDYNVSVREAGYYLPKVRDLDQEERGGRYCYTLRVGQDKLHSLRQGEGGGGVLASPAPKEEPK